MFPPGAEFLAKYVEDNIGKYGAVGRAPLGAVGFVAGMLVSVLKVRLSLGSGGLV
jgi:hypothetical protein